MSYSTTLCERKTLMRKIPQGIKKVNPGAGEIVISLSSSLDAIVNVLILFCNDGGFNCFACCEDLDCPTLLHSTPWVRMTSCTT